MHSFGAVFGLASAPEVDRNNRGRLRKEWMLVAMRLQYTIEKLKGRCLRVADFRRHLEGPVCLNPHWLHWASDNAWSEIETEGLKKEKFDEKLEARVDFVVDSAELEYVTVLASEGGYSAKDIDQIVRSRGFSVSVMQDRFERQYVKALAAHVSDRMTKEELAQAKGDLPDQFMGERYQSSHAEASNR